MTQASMAPVRKCALLNRVSTTMQSRVEEGSLKNQLERLRAHIAYRNSNYDERWVEIDTYEMKAVSGKDALRSKEFQRLFEDIRLKRVNVILAGSLDRVSRSVKDFQHLLEILTKEEVELISLKETFDTSTAHGRFFVNLMASLAELERDRTAERNSATTLSRADRGLWNGGNALGLRPRRKEGLPRRERARGRDREDGVRDVPSDRLPLEDRHDPQRPGLSHEGLLVPSRQDPSAEEVLVHEHAVAPVQPRVHREEGGQQEEADARPVEAPREPAVPGGRRELAADRLEGHVRQGPAPPRREPALRPQPRRHEEARVLAPGSRHLREM